MPSTAALTTAQAAAAAGVTRKAIRVYEAHGLIAPAARTSTGYRLFTEADITVLAFIRRARSLGLSLADIATILAARRAGTTPCGAVSQLVDARIAAIDEAIADLRTLRTALVATRRSARPDAAAAVCPIIETRGQPRLPRSAGR